MSVGLQRLREDAETVRKGAADKGEDASLVDRALELDERRRALLGEGDALKAERNAASKQIGEAIKGGARPDGPEVADLKAASIAAGSRIEAIDAALAGVEAEVEELLLRIPNPADPEVPVGGEEANVTVRTWGDQLGVDGDGPAGVGRVLGATALLPAQAAPRARNTTAHCLITSGSVVQRPRCAGR